MAHHIVKIADVPFEINTISEKTAEIYNEYLSEELPTFQVCASEEEIAQMKENYRRSPEFLADRFMYSDIVMERAVLQKKIMERMIDEKVLLIHGAAIVLDGEAYLFTAPSGTGKTTQVKLWLEAFQQRAYILNGDKPMVKIDDDTVRNYGTPWNGKEHIGVNASAPLKAIIYLSQSKENRIERVGDDDAFLMIYRQIYHGKDADRLKRSIELLNELCRECPVFRLECNMECDAVRTAYEGINKKR